METEFRKAGEFTAYDAEGMEYTLIEWARFIEVRPGELLAASKGKLMTPDGSSVNANPDGTYSVSTPGGFVTLKRTNPGLFG
jgi:hypothetical protein